MTAPDGAVNCRLPPSLAVAQMVPVVTVVVDVLKARLTMPQLSLEPLSTCEGTTVTCPLASRGTVIFLVIAVGAVASFTVTVNDAAVTVPQLLVAVITTVVVPKLKAEPLPVPEPFPVVA